MDTSISAINSVSNSSTNTQKTQDKNDEQVKELAQQYDFDHFDTDNDGKLSGSELS